MPFRLYIPLPGPFSYSRQIGGRRRRRSGPTLNQNLDAMNARLEAAATRQEARLRARGVDVERRRRINAWILSVTGVLLVLIVLIAVLG